MRTLFIAFFFLFNALIFAQPADCDDRQIYASLQVVHLDCDSIILKAYPNAISPNGDGVNDAFRVYPGQAASTVLSMKVFDRWGNLHYRGVTGDIKWEPSVETAVGVYVYTVKIRFANGQIRNYYGEITVLP